MSGRRATARTVLAGAATALVVASGLVWATPASASAYRYWSYWYSTSGTGGWTFSSVGAQRRPPAGSVDGWRFAVSGTAGSVRPRAAASFGTICGAHSPAPTGQKLVGLVVDYGTSADAPPGQHPPRGVDTFCAQVVDNASSGQVLTAYASVRSDSGLVCSIDGYPRNECGVIVTPSPKPSPRPTRSASPTSRPAPSSGATHAGAASPAASTSSPAATSSATGSSASASIDAVPTGGDQDPSPVAVGSGGVAPPSDGTSGAPVGAIVGGGLVLALGAAAAVRSRRPRSR
jgi:hypothetical protein